jgi:hypothetical protein
MLLKIFKSPASHVLINACSTIALLGDQIRPDGLFSGVTKVLHFLQGCRTGFFGARLNSGYRPN